MFRFKWGLLGHVAYQRGATGSFVAGVFVTRFKQLKELRRAVKSGTKQELQHAIDYCEMRLRLSTKKHHTKHWRQQLAEAEQAIDERFGTDRD